MIRITREQWTKISKDYKSYWEGDNCHFHPERIGKRVVFAGCIEKGGGTKLYTEGIDFEVV